MKMNTLFFIFLTIVMSGTTQNIQAMFKASIVLHAQIQRQVSLQWKPNVTVFSTLQEAREMRKAFKGEGFTKVFASEKSLWKQERQYSSFASGFGPDNDYADKKINDHQYEEYNGIRDYEKRDKEEIRIIAMEFVDLLTSRNGQSCEERVESQIVPIDEGRDEDLITKVYEYNGKVVGFHTYRIYQPERRFDWLYNMVASGPIGPDAHFSNFAVSSEYQGKGFGKELFLDAIKDCENRSVNRITLYTTEQASWKLEAFYQQNGFSWLNWRAFIMRGATFWSKRLKRHPMVIFTSGIFKWLNNGFKGE